jgi:type IVB pilus formation R64 PilN family outer membrane protein
MKLKSTVLVVGGLMVLNGCTTFENNAQRAVGVNKTLANTSNTVQDIRAKTSKPERPTIRYIDNGRQWASMEAVTIKEKVMPPELRCKLKLETNEPVSIFEFGQIVTKWCGIPVRITPDAISAIENPTSNAVLPQNGLMPTMSPASMSSPMPGPMSSAMAGMPGQRGTGTGASTGTMAPHNLIDINYHGELAGLLEMVTSRFGLLWKKEDDRIKIYNVDTETFAIHTLAGSTDMASIVQSGTTMVSGAAMGGSNGGGSGGGGGGGSGGVSGNSGTSQSTTVSLKTSIWDDIEKTIKTMKSVKGEYSISPGTGSITVTDNAETLSRVRNYVKQMNAKLSKQVMFNIKVVSVTTGSSDTVGISWDAVYKTVQGKFGFTLSSALGDLGSGSMGGLIVNSPTSPWAGSQAIISALNEQGGASVIKEPSSSTLNLQPLSVQVARQDGFLAGSSNVATAQVGNTTSIQTGIVTTGFNMSLFPYIMEDNRMLLQFSINLSNLRNLRKVTSQGASAEVPEVDMPINSTQKVRLKPGDTLILSGFDQMDETTNKTGAGSANNLLFGGTHKGASAKSSLVVLITPVILE